MMDVKVVKHGNSLALSLPSSAGFKRGEAFLLISDEKGGYLLIPKVKIPIPKQNHYHSIKKKLGRILTMRILNNDI